MFVLRLRRRTFLICAGVVWTACQLAFFLNVGHHGYLTSRMEQDRPDNNILDVDNSLSALSTRHHRALLQTPAFTKSESDSDREEGTEPKLRLALVRPFAPHDAEALIKSFDDWKEFLPCDRTTTFRKRPPSYTVDLFLSMSQVLSAYPEIAGLVNDMLVESDWKPCFGNIRTMDAHIPPEQDKYEFMATELIDPLWVNGPNSQFRHAVRTIQAMKNYDAMLLMELDSRPIRADWLGAVADEIIEKIPFSILGSKRHGSKWDENLVPKTSGDYINGNAVYNMSDQFFGHIVDQLETEKTSLYNAVPYDYRISQIVAEALEGNHIEFPFQGIKDEKGKSFDLQQPTLMLKKLRNLHEKKTVDDLMKESATIQDFAAVNFIPRQVSKSVAIVHGKMERIDWDSATKVTLVISDLNSGSLSSLLSMLYSATHPFSKVELIRSNDDAQAEFTPPSPVASESLPLNVQYRESPADFDLCGAQVSHDWFLLTDTKHLVAQNVMLFLTKDGKHKPIIPFTKADDGSMCMKTLECKQVLHNAQQLYPGWNKLFLDRDVPYNAPLRDAYCNAWRSNSGTPFYRPTATGYIAYLYSIGIAEDVYTFYDASLQGTIENFPPIYDQESPSQEKSENSRKSRGLDELEAKFGGGHSFHDPNALDFVARRTQGNAQYPSRLRPFRPRPGKSKAPKGKSPKGKPQAKDRRKKKKTKKSAGRRRKVDGRKKKRVIDRKRNGRGGGLNKKISRASVFNKKRDLALTETEAVLGESPSFSSQPSKPHTRYLTYAPDGGLSNQLMQLEMAVRLAERSRRVLVLPPLLSEDVRVFPEIWKDANTNFECSHETLNASSCENDFDKVSTYQWDNVIDVGHLSTRVAIAKATPDASAAELSTFSLCRFHQCNTRWIQRDLLDHEKCLEDFVPEFESASATNSLKKRSLDCAFEHTKHFDILRFGSIFRITDEQIDIFPKVRFAKEIVAASEVIVQRIRGVSSRDERFLCAQLRLSGSLWEKTSNFAFSYNRNRNLDLVKTFLDKNDADGQLPLYVATDNEAFVRENSTVCSARKCFFASDFTDVTRERNLTHFQQLVPVDYLTCAHADDVEVSMYSSFGRFIKYMHDKKKAVKEPQTENENKAKERGLSLASTEQKFNTVDQDKNLGNLLENRPIIIIKRPRAGSSWIVERINELSPHHHIEPEFTNRYSGQIPSRICSEVISTAHEVLKAGGFSLNPDKYGFATSMIPGTEKSCWDEFAESLRKKKPFVLIWRRLNVVAQAVSLMVSLKIKEENLCPDPYSSNRCERARSLRVTIEPADFVKQIRTSRLLDASGLYEYGKQLNSSSVYELFFEDLEAAGDGKGGLSAQPLELIPRKVESSGSRASYFTYTEYLGFPRGGTPRLQKVIKNFDEVKAYFQSFAPDLLPQLMAPSWRKQDYPKFDKATLSAIAEHKFPFDTRFFALPEASSHHHRILTDGVSNLCSKVVVGTQHQSGTVLAMKIFRQLCGGTSGAGNIHSFSTHASLDDFVPGQPFVYFIRDPLETVVSAYQYHLVSDEEWLQTTGHQERLRKARLEEGLELEFQRYTASDIDPTIKMYKFLKASSQTSDIFIVRLDDIRTEDNFKKFVNVLQSWLGLNAQPWEALSQCCFGGDESWSATSQGNKPQQRKVVMSQHADKINFWRSELDFLRLTESQDTRVASGKAAVVEGKSQNMSLTKQEDWSKKCAIIDAAYNTRGYKPLFSDKTCHAPPGTCKLMVVYAGCPRSGSTLSMKISDRAIRDLGLVSTEVKYWRYQRHQRGTETTTLKEYLGSIPDNVDVVQVKSHEFDSEILRICDQTLVITVTRDAVDTLASNVGAGFVSPSGCQRYFNALDQIAARAQCWMQNDNHAKLHFNYNNMAEHTAAVSRAVAKKVSELLGLRALATIKGQPFHGEANLENPSSHNKAFVDSLVDPCSPDQLRSQYPIFDTPTTPPLQMLKAESNKLGPVQRSLVVGRKSAEIRSCAFRQYPPHRYYWNEEFPQFLRKSTYIRGQFPTVLEVGSAKKVCIDQPWEKARSDGRLPFSDGYNPSVMSLSMKEVDSTVSSRLKLNHVSPIHRIFGESAVDSMYLALTRLADSQCSYRDDAETKKKFNISTFDDPGIGGESSLIPSFAIFLNSNFEWVGQSEIMLELDADFGLADTEGGLLGVTPMQENHQSASKFKHAHVRKRLDDPKIFVREKEVWISYYGPDYGYESTNLVFNKLHFDTSPADESRIYTFIKASETLVACCGRNISILPDGFDGRLKGVSWIDPLTVESISPGVPLSSAASKTSSIHGTNGELVFLPKTSEFLGIAHFHRPKHIETPCWIDEHQETCKHGRFGHHYTHSFYTITANPPHKIKRLSNEFVFPARAANHRNNAEIIQFASGLSLVHTNEVLVSYGINDCESAILRMPLKQVEDMLQAVPLGKEVDDLMKAPEEGDPLPTHIQKLTGSPNFDRDLPAKAGQKRKGGMLGMHIVIFGHDYEAGLVYGMSKRFGKIMMSLHQMGLIIHYICAECVDASNGMYSEKWFDSNSYTKYVHVYPGRTAEEQTLALLETHSDSIPDKLIAVVNFATHLTMNVKEKAKDTSQHINWRMPTEYVDCLEHESFVQKVREDGADLTLVIISDDVHHERLPFGLEKSMPPSEQTSNDIKFVERWVKKREEMCYGAADAVIAISEEDRKSFDGLIAAFEHGNPRKMHAKSMIVPYSSNLVTNPHQVVPFNDREDFLLIVGNPHSIAVESMVWFLREIWPVVRAKKSQLRFKIAGGHWQYFLGEVAFSNDAPENENPGVPHNKFTPSDWSNLGIDFLGFVDQDVLDTELFAKCKLFVVPHLNATGVSTKVVESLARGIPVLTNSWGRNGLNLEANPEADNVLAAFDDNQEFIDALFLLLDDQATWERTSLAAMKHTQTYLTEELVMKRMESALSIGWQSRHAAISEEKRPQGKHKFEVLSGHELENWAINITTGHNESDPTPSRRVSDTHTKCPVILYNKQPRTGSTVISNILRRTTERYGCRNAGCRLQRLLMKSSSSHVGTSGGLSMTCHSSEETHKLIESLRSTEGSNFVYLASLREPLGWFQSASCFFYKRHQQEAGTAGDFTWTDRTFMDAVDWMLDPERSTEHVKSLFASLGLDVNATKKEIEGKMLMYDLIIDYSDIERGLKELGSILGWELLPPAPKIEETTYHGRLHDSYRREDIERHTQQLKVLYDVAVDIKNARHEKPVL